MRQWPHDPTVAHLIFTDHHQVPASSDIDDAVEHARRRGARAVRTSALFPDATDVVLAAGFSAIDRLALLRYRFDRDRPPGSPTHAVRPLRPWRFGAAAEIDRSAFGPMWGNDAASLRDVRRATPHHVDRGVSIDRALVGFALSGAAADSGYLQRVAVAPTARRRGIARSLVLDALGWMDADGRTRCLVNTGVDNHAALALYLGLGFDQLDEVLTIAERPV